MSSDRDPLQIYALRKEMMQNAYSSLNAAIERVRTYAPNFLQPLSFSSIRALLPDKYTALVAFCITEQGSLGFVVEHNADQEIRMVNVPEFTMSDVSHLFTGNGDGEEAKEMTALGGWLGAYTHYLLEQTEETSRVWYAEILNTLATLSQHLLAPILSTLSLDIQRILFLPSTALFLAPLHAAPLSASESDLLCDHYCISYIPSLEVLSAIQHRTVSQASPSLYAVIDPETDPELIFSRMEGEALGKFFEHYTIDEGRAGTRERVIVSMHGQSHLYFSCHGTYVWQNPALSGFALADGPLTLAEILREEVDLSSVHLVTLASCETGITDIMKGSAEYVGIPAGFMLAGAPCVVCSPWRVPDLPTALVMEQFYRNHLSGKLDVAEALREAQLWLRTLSVGDVAEYVSHCYQKASRRDREKLYTKMRQYRYYSQEQTPEWRPFAHPYYWAAFTVTLPRFRRVSRGLR